MPFLSIIFIYIILDLCFLLYFLEQNKRSVAFLQNSVFCNLIYLSLSLVFLRIFWNAYSFVLNSNGLRALKRLSCKNMFAPSVHQEQVKLALKVRICYRENVLRTEKLVKPTLKNRTMWIPCQKKCGLFLQC